MHITKFTYQVFSLISSPKIHTNLLWDLTFLFLILGVIYFASVFFFRNKLSRLSARTKRKRQELAPIISNFLFHSSEDPKQEQKEYVELKIEIREYLNDKSFRKTISQILFDLQKDVAGTTRLRLFRLYKELELHHDAFKKLESWRWETVAQGILELSQMEVEESYQLIRKFINDRRGVVRKQAELATVSLRSDGIDYLLDTTRHAISEWQQLKLIEVLGKREDYRPPQFKGWLLSQNKDVVLFALRLIKHYNQNGAEPSIKELVKHKNDEIKIAAIQCIVDFNFSSAVKVLKNVFWNRSNRVKIQILNAIATLGTENDITFLEQVASGENSYIIVGKAQSTINSIAPESVLPSKDILVVNDHEEEIADADFQESLSSEEASIVLSDKTKGQDNKILESIEVEDNEYYDDVEFPEPKKDEKPVEGSNPVFEINSIEEEYGSPMEYLLGSSTKGDKNLDSKDLMANYDAIPSSEKSRLLDSMCESADERELPLLEHIAENETDSELRFRAFKKIQSIKHELEPREKQSQEPNGSSVNALSLAQQSIFYPLYHYTDDLDARLILLKELMEVGDEREIPFLKELLLDESKSIKKMAQKALEHINEKGSDTNPQEALKKVKQSKEREVVDLNQSEKVQMVEPETFQKEDERIPMELFLLYEELGIESSREQEQESSPFDFELSEEFFLRNHNSDKSKEIYE